MYPLILDQLKPAIARETAKMSWPLGMSRGPNGILGEGAKQATEEFFIGGFMDTLPECRAANYDALHRAQTIVLGNRLRLHQANPNNNCRAVARKLINTFMHQLMKYDRYRPLWCDLHLPLDNGIFGALGRIAGESAAVQAIIECMRGRSVYKIRYEDYMFIQNRLWDFIDELNRRPGMEFRLTSRIELNLLWAWDDC